MMPFRFGIPRHSDGQLSDIGFVMVQIGRKRILRQNGIGGDIAPIDGNAFNDGGSFPVIRFVIEIQLHVVLLEFNTDRPDNFSVLRDTGNKRQKDF